MVKAIVNISDEANRIINIIKAEYGLRDKSEAIDRMAEDYEELVFEPRVKASYLKKLDRIRKERTVKVGTIKDFEKKYGLDKP
jgi:hypothetical protein